MGADVGVGVKVRVGRMDVGGAGVRSTAALNSVSAETASMAADVRFLVRLAVMPSSIKARLYKPGATATSPSSRHASCDHVWRWHEPLIEPFSATAMRKISRNPWPVIVKPSESFTPDRLSIAGGRNTPNCTSPAAISTSCQSVTRCKPAGTSGTRSASSSLVTNVAKHGTDGEPSEQVKRAAREKPWPSKRTVMFGTATSGSTADIETAVAEATKTPQKLNIFRVDLDLDLSGFTGALAALLRRSLQSGIADDTSDRDSSCSGRSSTCKCSACETRACTRPTPAGTRRPDTCSQSRSRRTAADRCRSRCRLSSTSTTPHIANLTSSIAGKNSTAPSHTHTPHHQAPRTTRQDLLLHVLTSSGLTLHGDVHCERV